MTRPSRPIDTTAPITVVRPAGDPVQAARRLAARVPGADVELRAHGEPILAEDLATEARRAAGPEDEELALALAEATSDHHAAQAEAETRSVLRQQLFESATWCEEHTDAAVALAAAAAEAEAEVARAEAALAEAEARLASVAEQQAAAEAVLEQAHRQLVELDVAGQSENDVRRSLEGANQAARDANAAADAARAEAEALTTELLALEGRRLEIEAERASAQAVAEVDPSPVRAALERAEQAPLVDPEGSSLALADELERRSAQLVSLAAPGPEPTPEEHAAALATVAAARALLAELTRPPSNEPPPWWEHLGELHATVVDAEVAAGATLARGSARRRLEEALAAERAFLDEIGFPSHLDALLTGGRPPRRPEPDAIPNAEVALASAERRLHAIEAAEAEAAMHKRIRADVARHRALAGSLLGIASSEVTPAHLRAPRPDPSVATDLIAGLDAAGVAPSADTLVDRARRWLGAREQAADRVLELDDEREGLVHRTRTLVPRAEAATASAESASVAARAARRKVEVLEAELVNRIQPVTDPTVRAATAAALRDRIAALEGRLGGARLDAEAAQLAASAAVTTAIADGEAARRRLDELNRQVADATALLPHDPLREAQDVLDLTALGAALRAEYASVDTSLEELAGRIADAAARRDAAESTLADRWSSSELTGDLVADALHRLLADDARRTDVLLDPVGDLPPSEHAPVLDALVAIANRRPLVVVATGDALVEWAERPDVAAAAVVSELALELPAANADEPADPASRSRRTSRSPARHRSR